MLRKKLWIGICVVLLLLFGCGCVLYHLAVRGPDFYQQALNADPEESLRLGEQLVDLLLEAHNSAVREPVWSVELTAAQLNGWVHRVLEKKYPRLRLAQIDHLCFQLDQDGIRIAFQIRQAILPLVVCLKLVPYLTANGKHIAIRVETVRSGIIPLPKKQVTDRITAAFQRADIPLGWTLDSGQPLGLLPSSFPMSREIGRSWQIERLSISDGRLVVSGSAFDSP